MLSQNSSKNLMGFQRIAKSFIDSKFFNALNLIFERFFERLQADFIKLADPESKNESIKMLKTKAPKYPPPPQRRPLKAPPANPRT